METFHDSLNLWGDLISHPIFLARKAIKFFISWYRPGHRAGVHAPSILLKFAWIPDQVWEDTKKILTASSHEGNVTKE